MNYIRFFLLTRSTSAQDCCSRIERGARKIAQCTSYTPCVLLSFPPLFYRMPQSQAIFRKRATNYRALFRGKVLFSQNSSAPCYDSFHWKCYTFEILQMKCYTFEILQMEGLEILRMSRYKSKLWFWSNLSLWKIWVSRHFSGFRSPNRGYINKNEYF